MGAGFIRLVKRWVNAAFGSFMQGIGAAAELPEPLQHITVFKAASAAQHMKILEVTRGPEQVHRRPYLGRVLVVTIIIEDDKATGYHAGWSSSTLRPVWPPSMCSRATLGAIL